MTMNEREEQIILRLVAAMERMGSALEKMNDRFEADAAEFQKMIARKDVPNEPVQ